MKAHIKTLVTFLIFIPIFSGQFSILSAQNDEVKTLINKAIEYYPKLKSQQATVDVSKTRIDINKSYNLPSISGDLSYHRIDPVSKATIPTGPGTYNEFKFVPNDNYNAQISLYYPVLDFGKTKASIEKSSQEYLMANDNLDNSRFNLAFQVANVYYAIVYLNKSIVVKDAEIKLLDDNIKIIESKIKYGDGLDYDLLSTQVKKTNAENQKSDLQNALQKQLTALNTYTGQDNSSILNSKVDFNYDANFVASDSLLQMAYASNYDVKLGIDKTKVAASDVKINSKNNNVVLAISGGLGIRNGYLPDLAEITPNTAIGASLSVPIFTGNRNDNLYKISKINQQASQFDLDATKLNVQKDLQQLLSDIQNNLDKYRSADTQIKQSQRAVELGDTRYKNGVITNLELLNSQTNLMLAQLNKLVYEYQLSVSQLELKRLTGQRFW
ncbi:MAG: TolC family protein [Bacteroidia bacterium]